MDRTAKAEELLRELGGRARLVVYVASAPGSGKTRRLLEDARRLACRWKARRDRLDRDEGPAGSRARRRGTAAHSAAPSDDRRSHLRRLRLRSRDPHATPTSSYSTSSRTIISANAAHAKRWQDALALKGHGIGVIGAFNIQHLETVAPTAEGLIGYPVREIVPLSFLQAADEVVALDVSPRILQSRVRAGKIVNEQDVDRALNGIFKEQTLYMLRELLLRTVDSLTLPAVKAGRTSMAAAFVFPDVDPIHYLKRASAASRTRSISALEVVPVRGVDRVGLERIARELGGEMLGESVRSHGTSGRLVARRPRRPSATGAWPQSSRTSRYLTTCSSSAEAQTYLGRNPLQIALLADGRAIGCGLATASSPSISAPPQARERPTRCSTARINCAPTASTWLPDSSKRTAGKRRRRCSTDWRSFRRDTVTANGITYTEFDRDALIARHPQVALIDELAHTNAPGSVAPKRYHDVLAVLRAGIDVITTLNIQHLEGLGDTVLAAYRARQCAKRCPTESYRSPTR